MLIKNPDSVLLKMRPPNEEPRAFVPSGVLDVRSMLPPGPVRYSASGNQENNLWPLWGFGPMLFLFGGAVPRHDGVLYNPVMAGCPGVINNPFIAGINCSVQICHGGVLSEGVLATPSWHALVDFSTKQEDEGHDGLGHSLKAEERLSMEFAFVQYSAD
ncbi:hypothetical protein CSOJ01_14254 [Colletotrichum sojae]|uniref:Uncharacterized protein n=1 Tax=Colletotrichum sojae TaxID=2175907 RepID=A0A8H6MK54_9PEZI|nr:hypothetical protein CSOJ01_14254 [Colletotrichum sojae]